MSPSQSASSKHALQVKVFGSHAGACSAVTPTVIHWRAGFALPTARAVIDTSVEAVGGEPTGGSPSHGLHTPSTPQMGVRRTLPVPTVAFLAAAARTVYQGDVYRSQHRHAASARPPSQISWSPSSRQPTSSNSWQPVQAPVSSSHTTSAATAGQGHADIGRRWCRGHTPGHFIADLSARYRATGVVGRIANLAAAAH